MLKLDTCLYSNISSERTAILAGHITERDSEAQRSLDTCFRPVGMICHRGPVSNRRQHGFGWRVPRGDTRLMVRDAATA